MTKEEAISKIIEIEWDMFHNVNGDTRADCQDNQTSFIGLRHAQYVVWNEELVNSFLEDITKAKEEGRNLSREKYIRMMESTDPNGYEHFKGELPEAPEESAVICDNVWAILLEQTKKMREKYPLIAYGGRPLTKADETTAYPSVETYQKCEMMTYSLKTLQLLLKQIKEMAERGEEYAYIVQSNSVTCMGFKDMDEAERAMAAKVLKDLGAEIGGGCCCCG